MAFSGIHSLDQISQPRSCDGVMRLRMRGAMTIAGVTKVDGLTAPCRVFLYAGDGVLQGYRRSAIDGTYQFAGLAPGEYRLVIEDDQQGTRRAKIEHVLL